MRGFLAAAILLTAGSVGHAQYFSAPGPGGEPIEIVIPQVCGDPSCVYVRVPGYVEIGRRYAPPPPPAYYEPPPAYGTPPGYEPRGGYRPPPGALPDYAEDDDEPPYYIPPPATHRPIRQPRQIQGAPKKKLPKVAAIRDASPARTPVARPAVPAQKPVPESMPAASKPAETQSQKSTAPTPSTAPAAGTAPTPPAAENPAPAPPAVAATVVSPIVVPSSNATPSPSSEVAPEKPAAVDIPAPQVEAAATPSSEPPKTGEPSTTTATEAHKTDPTESPATQPVAKPSRTVVAALPPAKRELEERAKPVPGLPIGVWSSNDGQVRIQSCGRNLCGYAVGGAHAGTMVLIQMRQTTDNSWSGQVNDVRSGQNYSATMSMRGPNALNIQGCALGGLFCGSRTMSRVQ